MNKNDPRFAGALFNQVSSLLMQYSLHPILDIKKLTQEINSIIKSTHERMEVPYDETRKFSVNDTVAMLTDIVGGTLSQASSEEVEAHKTVEAMLSKVAKASVEEPVKSESSTPEPSNLSDWLDSLGKAEDTLADYFGPPQGNLASEITLPSSQYTTSSEDAVHNYIYVDYYDTKSISSYADDFSNDIIYHTFKFKDIKAATEFVQLNLNQNTLDGKFVRYYTLKTVTTKQLVSPLGV